MLHRQILVLGTHTYDFGRAAIADLSATTMAAKPIEIVIGGDYNGDIHYWKVEDGQQQGSTVQAAGSVLSIVVSDGGQWIVSGDWEKEVTIWNLATHKIVFEITEHKGRLRAVDISRGGTVIVLVDDDTIQMVDTASGDRFLPPLPHDGVYSVKFSPNGSRFATASSSSGFRIYSTHNGDILFDSGGKTFHSWLLTNPLAWSSDGQQLFIAGEGKVTCFNVSSASSSEWSIEASTRFSTSISLAPNGRFIAHSSGSSIALWDCASHKQIGSIGKHNSDFNCVALSPSGGYLACGIGKNITIHNLRDFLPAQYFYHRVSMHPLMKLASLIIITRFSCLHNALICRQLNAPQLPLLQVSDATLKSWTQDDPTNTEMLLSEEIMSASSPNHYLLANRALISARLKDWALAMEDVKGSLQVKPSPIGHIAMAVALLGQGDREGALCTFDLAFHDCDPHDIKFLLLLKLILVFESGNQEEAIMRVEYLATRANNDDDATYLYTQKGNYGRAMPLIERAKNLAPKGKQYPPLKTISLIFGWSFDGLDIVAQQHLCETLYTGGRTSEAVEILLDVLRTSDGEMLGSRATVDWVLDSSKKCGTTLEHMVEKAFVSAELDVGLAQYSDVPPLDPLSPTGLLIRRSRARATEELWEDALQDAIAAVQADPSYPWGYEAKYMALQGAKRYDEAIDVYESMLHVIEQSDDPAIRQLRKNYISPSETITAIDLIVSEIHKSCPLILIDVTTGRLCDDYERTRIFKADPSFAELVLSMTRELDNERIRGVVTSLFAYVMFSHAWQGEEPSFQDINWFKSVWSLPVTPLNDKLYNFCKETGNLHYRWAWSDTCCIDKDKSSILNQSLTSMYKWYADSAATLVFLAGVKHPSKLGDLTHSLWMTRAWTLQELLAPKVILFYDSEWKPYLGDLGTNHKDSREIMQELADAIKVSRETIITFSPDDLGVREKLRLASTRRVMREEDVAYSLIGIFKSDIRPHYGEGADDALGHLLEEIVARSGEVSVLAWSGKSSSYNSCLPASISVYNKAPHNPPSLEGEEMDTCIRELRGWLSQQVALGIYNQISSLPPVRFAARRLHLPCIVFSVKKLNMQGPCGSNEKLYRARVSGIGYVEFRTADDLLVHRPRRLVFAHPWIRHIRDSSSGVAWGGDFESDTDSDSDVFFDAESDEAEPSSPSRVAAAPQVDDYPRALRMIARLKQPFNALLLVQQPNGEYKRVAAENEIVISGVGLDITSKNIRVKVLEIL
ncbi:hypothetical protein EDC04DRAFT_3137168 [Pisolithus marmoratus]|nr:hypothetical protein EDC04DRAFT_3137168 [Pisolithus marmoratus]